MMSGQSLESGTRRSVDVAALAATPTERAQRRPYCITECGGVRVRAQNGVFNVMTHGLTRCARTSRRNHERRGSLPGARGEKQGLSAGGVPIIHPARRPTTYPSLMSSLTPAQGAIAGRRLRAVDLSGGLLPFVASGEGRCP